MRYLRPREQDRARSMRLWTTLREKSRNLQYAGALGRFHNGAKSRQLCCVLIYVPDSIWHPECDGSPHSILFRHSNNEFFELFLGARSTWTTLVVTVVFLCNQ